MGTFGDDLRNEINDLLGSWTIRDGRKIPEQDDIGYGNVGSKIEATVLYADLANSTGLVRDYKAWFAAAVSKAFLLSAVRIIRQKGGKITSFDGDRVMGIFYGDSQDSDAAIAAQQINYAVAEIIKPSLKAKYPNTKFVPSHCVGIDRSAITAVRAGIRGSNDLIWIGKAANYAAVLSDIRTSYKTYMTHRVYNNIDNRAKFKNGNGENKWTKTSVTIKGASVECYKSTYWSPI